jgi:hypothetical protein
MDLQIEIACQTKKKIPALILLVNPLVIMTYYQQNKLLINPSMIICILPTVIPSRIEISLVIMLVLY